MNESKPRINIIDLKPDLEDVHVKGRVLSTTPPKVINTRKGARTISNAVIGDETGRVDVTLWGEKAGTLHEGEVVDIDGAWTSSYRGKVQLNIGRSTSVNVVEDNEAPPAENIPEDQPKAPMNNYRPRRGYGRRGGFRRRM
jgi:replication factor A1